MESLTAKSVCFDCFSEETQLFVRLNRVVDEVVELKKLQYIHMSGTIKRTFCKIIPPTAVYSCIQLYTAVGGIGKICKLIIFFFILGMVFPDVDIT